MSDQSHLPDVRRPHHNETFDNVPAPTVRCEKCGRTMVNAYDYVHPTCKRCDCYHSWQLVGKLLLDGKGDAFAYAVCLRCESYKRIPVEQIP